MLSPPRIVPPAAPLGRLAFARAFVRNPLAVVPQRVYEEDYVPIAGTKRVWVTSPVVIKGVLLDERDKFRKLTQIRLLAPLLGKGILTSEGADWKWQRQAAAPMFRREELAGFVPTFVRAAENTVARWRGGVQQIEEDMTRATFEVIAATLLPSADETFAAHMQRSIRAMQRNGGWDILYAQVGIPLWFPRPGMLMGARAARTLRKIVGDLLDKQHDSRSLLSRLISARDPESNRSMDRDQLVDNLLTFYLAGHETTAKALTWTLYLLARSPEWTAKLEEEIERVTDGAPVESAHIDKLVQVQQVLKESMRLYPPVPIMSRQAVADAQIHGHDIAAGTSVLMPIYAIHRHARRWEDPDAFDPTRFSPQREATISRYQYLPFGAGPRICIGMTFAMVEATAILATLLQKARFSVPEGVAEPSPVARVTLMPGGGMPLAVDLIT